MMLNQCFKLPEDSIRRRVESVLTQLGGELARGALAGEVMVRLRECETDEELEELDLVYRVTLDALVEYWQDKRRERLDRWGLVAGA